MLLRNCFCPLAGESGRGVVFFRIVPVTQHFGRKEMRPPIYEDGHVFRDSVMIEKKLQTAMTDRGSSAAR